MAVVRGIRFDTSTGEARQLYEDDLRILGYVANSTKVFALRPDVHAAWRTLLESIRANMIPRRYELVALAVEAQLRSEALKPDRKSPSSELKAIARDHGYAPLTAGEVAIMTFASRAALRGHRTDVHDINALRAHGCLDSEILDIGVAASVLCFWSKALGAVGEQPDEAYMTLDEGFRRAMMSAPSADLTEAQPVVPGRPGRGDGHVDGHRRLRRIAIATGLVLAALGGLIVTGAPPRRSVRQPPEPPQPTVILPGSNVPYVGDKIADTRPGIVRGAEFTPPRSRPRANGIPDERAFRNDQRAPYVTGDETNPEEWRDAKPDALTPAQQQPVDGGAPQSREQVATQEAPEATKMLTTEMPRRQQIAPQSMERLPAGGQGPSIRSGSGGQVYGERPQQYGTLGSGGDRRGRADE
jgi:alkylhydroperoxidase family enzyme